MITRRAFLKRGGGLSLALVLGPLRAFPAGAAPDPALLWPMFRRDLRHTGYAPERGRVRGPDLRWRFGADGDVEPSAAVGDVDGDGRAEVVISDFAGVVYALDGSTRGTSITPKWRFESGKLIWSSPAIGDVDGDGRPEVVVGSDDGNVYVLSGATGTLKWRFSTPEQVRSSAALADVDGDGEPEIVIASNRVYALAARRRRVKWSFPLQTSTFSSPAVADVDGDGELEVVIGSYDNAVYALSGSSGALKWSFFAGNQVQSSPALADIDGDGELEVVFGFGDISERGDKGVYALGGRSGRPKWFFKLGENQRVISSPAIGDVDGDGELEVAIGTNADRLYVLGGPGDGRGGAEVKHTHQAGNKIESSPALGDIDGDGAVEIVVGSHDFHLYVLEAVPGRPRLRVEWSFSTAGTSLQPIIFSSPTLADIDGDGELEVVVGSSNSLVYAFDSP